MQRRGFFVAIAGGALAACVHTGTCKSVPIRGTRAAAEIRIQIEADQAAIVERIRETIRRSLAERDRLVAESIQRALSERKA